MIACRLFVVLVVLIVTLIAQEVRLVSGEITARFIVIPSLILPVQVAVAREVFGGELNVAQVESQIERSLEGGLNLRSCVVAPKP